MAREAKVGLLLGLVFIVAIAIVLRGVHENGPAQLEASLGIPPKDVKPLEMETLSVAVDSLAPVNSKIIPPQENRPVSQSGVALPVNSAAQQNLATAPPSQPQPVRYQQDLPRGPYVQNQAAQFEPLANQEPVTPLGKLPDTVTAALDKITFEPKSKIIDVAALTPPKRPKASLYIVQKGDDLSRIALKVYGREEGKRWVNVEKIYKANRKILPSADMIREGQRLVIPALAHRITPQQSPQVSPQQLQPAPRKHPGKTRNVYVVKDGDSLWKIAENQLGNGGRYNEIVDLNTTSLRDENNLFVGMRLKLPLQ